MIRLFVFSIIVLIGLRSATMAAGYFTAIEDLPLPQTLAESIDDSVVFDSPQGRIVTVVARGFTTVEAVKSYYSNALPPLGWRPDRDGRFSRDDETLSFEYFVSGRSVTVRIKLLPATRG